VECGDFERLSQQFRVVICNSTLSDVGLVMRPFPSQKDGHLSLKFDISTSLAAKNVEAQHTFPLGLLYISISTYYSMKTDGYHYPSSLLAYHLLFPSYPDKAGVFRVSVTLNFFSRAWCLLGLRK